MRLVMGGVERGLQNSPPPTVLSVKKFTG